jgi:chemotaxis family two-component system response regulator Rcp1
MSPIQILLVEDNLGDVRLTEEALKDAKVHTLLSVARDGVEAMSFLRKTGKFADSPTPDIILLDLNLPKMNGLEVLKEVKTDQSLLQIPVVVITSSKAEEDVAKSYHLHANCYITKPIDFNQFMVVVQSIENFWFTIVRLPNRK